MTLGCHSLPQSVIPIAGSLGYNKTVYILEDETLTVAWGKIKQETVVEIVGPKSAPFTASTRHWAKGTIKTTSGKEYILDFILSPHTLEQGGRVFQERQLDAIAQRRRRLAQPNRYKRAEFIRLAQAKNKELAQIWMAKAGDDVVAFEAAMLWAKLQSWREVGKLLHKKTGKVYSAEGARKAAQRFYDVVAGPGKVTSNESLRDFYTREGCAAQRRHDDNIRGEVDAKLTPS